MSQVNSQQSQFVVRESMSIRRSVAAALFSLCSFVLLLCAGNGYVEAAAADPASFSANPAATAKNSGRAQPDDSDEIRLYDRLDQRMREKARTDRVPEPAIDALLGIFSDDVDLQRAVRPGDAFAVYSIAPAQNSRVGETGVMFVALTYDGQTKRYYRFKTADGVVAFYDENGRSANKFMVRRPIETGTVQALFGPRRNPVLGVTKLHAGVDWMAPTGTPIFAAGEGKVEAAGWDSAYGKRVRLRHQGIYVTAYAHLSAIADGITPGAKVEKGQVIGYAGATGISTGTHLHYEVTVSGRYVDPLAFPLPPQRVLDGAVLDDFQRERERLDVPPAGKRRFTNSSRKINSAIRRRATDLYTRAAYLPAHDPMDGRNGDKKQRRRRHDIDCRGKP